MGTGMIPGIRARPDGEIVFVMAIFFIGCISEALNNQRDYRITEASPYEQIMEISNLSVLG